MPCTCSSRYAAERRLRSSATVSEALIQAARDAGPACLITTLTTAAAFLSFTTSALDTFLSLWCDLRPSRSPPASSLSFSLLPILLKWLPADAPRAERATDSWNYVMDAVVRTTTKRATTLLAASAVLLAFFGLVGWSQLRVDQDWLESVGDRSESVRAERFMEDRVGLSQSLELDISLPPGTAFRRPRNPRKLIETLSNSLVQMPELTQVHQRPHLDGAGEPAPPRRRPRL